MPAFAKNPKFIIGTLVVLWVGYVLYTNYQLDMVTFYLLPFDILKLQLKLSAIVIGAAVFGSIVTLVIQWLWGRSSNSNGATGPLPDPKTKTAA
ncbi:MAG TPA: hypothetical protein VMU16_05405 [Candidatus Binataceae bacterium]|nr:hypothetical protein [Candidatus Binataceae bacterium]